jgi:hypothetical protein
LTDILDSILKLEKFILSENYKGYDPYDSLMSPLFKLPFFRSNKLLRFGFQQVYRRIPFNTRGILGIKKGINPVTLGLCIQGFSYLAFIIPEKREFYTSEIDKLLIKLFTLKSKGYSGMCWGYDFDWEARYTQIPAYCPTIVATGIITNSLFVNYKLLGNVKSLDLCKDAVNFVLKDLNKSFSGETFCYSYSPYDKQKVFNATMKGARLLSQVYSVTKDDNLYNEAKKTIAYVMNNQKENGSWSYAKDDARKWVDNFHTGYVIECLFEYCNLIDSDVYRKNLDVAVDFYKKNFLCENGIPKYYSNSVFPIDSTSAAQTIITLSKVECIESAKKVIDWFVSNMQSKKGNFYFQRRKLITNKISYIRWSDAWMLVALSYFLYKKTVK